MANRVVALWRRIVALAGWARRRWLWIVGPPVGVAVCVLVVPAAPEYIRAWIALSEKDREGYKSLAVLVAQLSTPLLAGLALYFAARRLRSAEDLSRAALRQASNAEKGQVTERFSKAVEQLADTESVSIRLGGIYSLEAIARDLEPWDPFRATVVDVLCAYLREKSPSASGGAGDAEANPADSLAIDLQACVSALLRCAQPKRLDLSRVDLRKADLSGADLSGAELGGADLRMAYLRGADLSGADLSGAKLIEADLGGAKLHEANLRFADLRVAENVTNEQMQSANGDPNTQIPVGVARPRHWT